MAVTLFFKHENGIRDSTTTFQSNDGEDYAVKFKADKRDSQCGVWRIEWEKISNKYITITYVFEYNGDKYRSYSSFVKDQAFALISAASPHNNSIILLNVSPCVPPKSNPSGKKWQTHENHLSLQTTTPTKTEMEKKLEQLSTDMGNLLQTGKLSDIVLTDGSKEIHAHKAILSARSSVFDKMFQHPMKETRENRITIEDVPIEVLKELLHYMYTGNVTIKNSGMARELYVASDKYDVQELRNICSTMLTEDVDSVLDTLLLADLYSDKVLKEAALKFISKNYSQLKQLQSWNSFMKENQSLAIEILSFPIDKEI